MSNRPSKNNITQKEELLGEIAKMSEELQAISKSGLALDGEPVDESKYKDLLMGGTASTTAMPRPSEQNFLGVNVNDLVCELYGRDDAPGGRTSRGNSGSRRVLHQHQQRTQTGHLGQKIGAKMNDTSGTFINKQNKNREKYRAIVSSGTTSSRVPAAGLFEAHLGEDHHENIHPFRNNFYGRNDEDIFSFEHSC